MIHKLFFLTNILFLLMPVQLSFCEVIVEPVYINGDSISVWDVEVDSNGDVYVSQSPQGVLKYFNNNWIQLHSDSSIDISLDNIDILWKIENTLFGRYADGAWTYYDYDYKVYPVSYIEAAADNVIWAVTDKTGVCRFDFNNNTVTVFNESDGVAHTYGLLIATTSDGHVWISHTEIGFCEICVYEGVSHFDGENWETFNEDNGLLNEEVRAIVAYSANEVYIGGWKGIVKYNGETLEPFADYRADTMAKGPDGALWVATWADYNIPAIRRQIYKKYHNGEIYQYERNDCWYPWKIVVDKNENVWSKIGNRLYKTKTANPVSVDTAPVALSLTIYAHPNPFNPVTNITYKLPTDSHIQLAIFNINGQKVATLVDDFMPAGKHAATFDGSNLASGVYFYSFESKGFTKTGKMLLIK